VITVTEAELNFYFDPVCPFAWLTSTWVRQVAAQRDFAVDWRFISLRLLNAHIDYASHFPPDYEAGHTAGLRLLRVAARVRAAHGRDAVGPLYEAFGRHLFEVDRQPDIAVRGSREFVAPVLAEAGLPPALAAAVDDESADVEIQAETDEALTLTGKDVGTPILHFHPPEGRSFFGPVISRVPSDAQAVELWDHVVALAGFPGFAELKRSLRERPQLPASGVRAAEAGVEEDWHGGSRRPEEGRAAPE
jgi:2-hydroxychromene-2-carboxylate isomerase